MHAKLFAAYITGGVASYAFNWALDGDRAQYTRRWRSTEARTETRMDTTTFTSFTRPDDVEEQEIFKLIAEKKRKWPLRAWSHATATVRPTSFADRCKRALGFDHSLDVTYAVTMVLPLYNSPINMTEETAAPPIKQKE